MGRARGGRRSRRTPSARCGALRLQRSGLCSTIVLTRQATAPPRAPPRQPKPADDPATGWPRLGTAGAPQQAGGGHGAAERPRNFRSSGWGREAWRTAIWGSMRRPSTRCARAGPSASASRPLWRISWGVGSDELRRRFESSWVALRSDRRDGDSDRSGQTTTSSTATRNGTDNRGLPGLSPLPKLRNRRIGRRAGELGTSRAPRWFLQRPQESAQTGFIDSSIGAHRATG